MTAWRLAIFCCSIFLSAAGDSSVHIINKYDQQVTSSTLNWLSHAHYHESKEFVIGAIEIAPETLSNDAAEMAKKDRGASIFVCRALHNGIWVAGGQKEGDKRCSVTMSGAVRYYDRYDLLENVDGAARLVWVDWDKYHVPKVGTVGTMTTDKMYVARHVAVKNETDDAHFVRQTHYIGTLNAQETFGMISYVKEGDEIGYANSGELLVEIEPIYYELYSVRLNMAKSRVPKRTPKTIGSAVMMNSADRSAEMAEAFSYSYNYTMYWGQGHAILKGLNTSITLQNKTKLPDIIWGIEERKNVTDLHTVSVTLEPGTAVNVTLMANYTETEVAYSGKLISHFEDRAESKSRHITGFRREETLMDVSPVFGPVYFISNLSLVPTTVPPPTTEPPTTTRKLTTETTPMSTNNQPIYEVDQNLSPDENTIVPHDKPENSNMQRDEDGGPQSLKNKADGSDSGARGLRCSMGLLAVMLATAFHRIT